MNMNLDPTTVQPTPGKILVEIVEVLGGTTKSGLFRPPQADDHMGKDTFYGKILCVGPPPVLEHHRDPTARGGYHVRDAKSGKAWSEEVMAQFTEGDIMIFPRDVPLAFGFEDRRFALVLMHEAMFSVDPASFDPTDFEVVPWTAPAVP